VKGVRVSAIYNTILCLWYVYHQTGNHEFWTGITRPARPLPAASQAIVANYTKNDIWFQEKGIIGPQRNEWTFFRLSHIAGGHIWSLLMILQLFDKPRLMFPALHRISGRLTLVLSVGISLSGFEGLILRPRVFHRAIARFLGDSVADVFNVGELWPLSTSTVPSMPGMSPFMANVWRWGAFLDFYLFWIINILLMVTAFVAPYMMAVKRDLASHKRWAIRHTMYGTWVMVRRMIMTAFVRTLAVAAASSPTSSVWRWILGIQQGTPFVLVYMLSNFLAMVLHIVLAEVMIASEVPVRHQEVKKIQ